MGGLITPPYPPGMLRVLFRLVGADFNITTDQQLVKLGVFTNYLVVQTRFADASGSCTSAVGSIWTGPGGTGTPLCANAPFTSLNGAGVGATLGAVASSAGSSLQTATPYFKLDTPQGAARTANIFLFGIPDPLS